MLRHCPHLAKPLRMGGAAAQHLQGRQDGGTDYQTGALQPPKGWCSYSRQQEFAGFEDLCAASTHLRYIRVGLAIHAQRSSPVATELRQRAQLRMQQWFNGTMNAFLITKKNKKSKQKASSSGSSTLKAMRRLRSGDDTLRWAWDASRLCMHNARLL